MRARVEKVDVLGWNKSFTVQDLPDHSKTNQYFPSTIMFSWESSSGLGSSRGASFELDKAKTKADIFLFGISDLLSLPSSEVTSEEYIGDFHLRLSILFN